MNEVKELEKLVINNGYCIGCGVCTSLDNSPFKIRLNEFGNYVAYFDCKIENSYSRVLEICPFSNKSLDENQLAQIFLSDTPNNHPLIGNYFECFAGYVRVNHFRRNGSSGGIGKWIGYKLLKENLVDFYVHVSPCSDCDDSSKPLFEYKIINDPKQIFTGSKSSYYPVTLEMVIKEIKKSNGRYGITGVPCFIKAIRLLSNYDPEFKSKIRFTIGLICGGLKSANFAKLVGWQLGIKPDDLGGIDFRFKSDFKKQASHNIYMVWSKRKDIIRTEFTDSIFGARWFGYFMPKPCFYCDDVVAETADISLGDAWLPAYEKDPKGTNIIIIRNKEILDLFKRSYKFDEIHLEKITAEEVVQSQAGGFRQRREALSYRIKKKEKSGNWYPIKRVKSDDYLISKKRERIYSLREKIAMASQRRYVEAESKRNVKYFRRKMMILEIRYLYANKGSLFFIRYFLGLIKNRIIRLVKGTIHT